VPGAAAGDEEAGKAAVPRWFPVAFLRVVQHYGLDEAEIEEAKKAVRADLANALVSYREMDEALQFRYTGSLPVISLAELEQSTRSEYEKRMD
jgi:outer membrane receptor for Fe3+-dicitrate